MNETAALQEKQVMATRRSTKRPGKRTPATAEQIATTCASETSDAHALLGEPMLAPSAGLDAARGLDASAQAPLEVVTFVDDDSGLRIERTLRGARIVSERLVVEAAR
jgi:hypothetical protein